MLAKTYETVSREERDILLGGRQMEKTQPRVRRKTPRILLAEDDFEMRRFLATALRMDGYEVTEASDGVTVLDRIGPYLYNGMQFDYDLIISDIRMPGVDGLEILAGLRMCDGAPPVILITAFGNRRIHMEAERFGAADILDKPFDIEDLRAVVRRVVPPLSEQEGE